MIEILKEMVEAFEIAANGGGIDFYAYAKTGRQAIAKLESQEPVACGTYQEVTDTMNALWAGTLEQVQIAEEMKNKKLYTAPPQRTWQGLTDEEVKHEWEVWRANIPRYAGFAKGIETKLKEKNT